MVKNTPIFVIIGNPPYNVGQVNENDNNKNRKYKELDEQIKDSYAKDSKATNKNALSDVFVKAFKWATWRLQDKEEGIVAFVSNNSFLDNIAFDGMRQHLAQDFNKIYILDLKGNVRKDSMREGVPIGEAHTVFGLSAMVGISVTFLVKTPKCDKTKIYYSTVDWKAKRKEKFEIIEKAGNYFNLNYQAIEPDKKYTWLTEGLHAEFDNFIPLGTKKAKATRGKTESVIFKIYSRGVATSRDAWAYNFDRQALAENMQKTIEFYNTQVLRFQQAKDKPKDKSELARFIDDFVEYDDTKLFWSRDLKLDLKRCKLSEFEEEKLRTSLYRPFTKSYLFFDRIINEEVYVFPSIFPTPATENENRVLCVSAVGNVKNFQCLIVNVIPDLHLTGDSQCFPFYTYTEDGSNRQENMTDWTLNYFQRYYQDTTLTKWDIFYYVYGLLHQPAYREKYAANLKRELPRIPCADDFWLFSNAGKQLADLHLNYEQQAEYPLKFVFNKEVKPSYRVEKMRLNKAKDSLIYNESLTLQGIPSEIYQYRLGNRSALEWVIDQYQVKVDKRSGIVNDPNNLDDEQYILRLIKQVITVSLETVKIVKTINNFNYF